MATRISIGVGLTLSVTLTIGLVLALPTAVASVPSLPATTATSPDGTYAVIDSAGGVITYGQADYDGDMLASTLDAPVVGAVADRDGGYWMDASDGGVFAFGDARFYGSMGGKALNQPVVSMAATPDGHGYWLVAADGGIFAFGDARFYGSMGGTALSSRIAAMTATPDGAGYWMVGQDDSVYAFGDAAYSGGASSPLHPPLYPAFASPTIPRAVAIVATPVGAQAAHRGGVRVAFLGDSLAWYEGYYTSDSDAGYRLDNGSIPGCGATNGAEMQMWTRPGVDEPSLPACSLWAAQMEWVTRRYHPDAVVIQLGYWEEQTRLWGGRYVNLGDPAYAAYIQQNLERAVSIAHGGGASVIINTSPYFGDGTPNWIVNDFNALVAAVAAQNPSFVTVLNVNHILSPNGTYTQDVDGLAVRPADNVHLTMAGVHDLIDPVLNPMALAVGSAVYQGTS
jgi:TM2 domain-containing membrane protein YozV